MAVVAFIIGGVATLGISQLGGDGSDERPSRDGTDETARAEETTSTEATSVATTLAEPGAPREPTCPPDNGSSEPVRSFTGPPPMCIDLDRTYVATVETTRGEFEITLDPEAAPQTANNFVFLTRWRFYEGAGFFQVLPGYSITTGDPIGGVGSGDPGYVIEGEPPTGTPYYPELSAVMAGDTAGATSSVFFVVTGPTAETLPPRYSRFGRVTAGEDTVRAIEATGTETGVPTEETVIERITISEE